jgi:hypothetical protein
MKQATFNICRACTATALLGLVVTGCVTVKEKPASAETEEQAAAPVDTQIWRRAEATRPPLDEIRRVRAGLPDSLQTLALQLRDNDVGQRRQAAYIAEALLAQARGCLPDLLLVAVDEKDPVTRAIMVRTIANIGDTSEETLIVLRQMFRNEEHAVVLVYLAGAVALLDLGSDQQVAEDWLARTIMLSDDPEAVPERTGDFWEQCWAAMYMIGKLADQASRFVPVLEHFGDVEDVPTFVERQVGFTLARLQQQK